MWPNPQKTADLVPFTEKNLNVRLHYFYSEGFAYSPETLAETCKGQMW